MTYRSKNNWLAVKLKESANDRDVQGPTYTFYVGAQKIEPSCGFHSTNTYALHLGSGCKRSYNPLVVSWSDQEILTKSPIECCQIIDIQKYSSLTMNKKGTTQLFNIYGISIDYQHVPITFRLFKIQRHMPFYQTDKSTPIISGDLDGKMKEDIIFDRSQDNPTKLYFQKGSETFESQILSPNLLNVSSVLMHDMDGDSHFDLVIAPGSYRHKPDELKASIHIFYQLGPRTISETIIPLISGNLDSICIGNFYTNACIDNIVRARTGYIQYLTASNSALLLSYKCDRE